MKKLIHIKKKIHTDNCCQLKKQFYNLLKINEIVILKSSIQNSNILYNNLALCVRGGVLRLY